MKNYIIRNMPDELWRKFKTKCAAEGISIKKWLLDKITEWIQ